MRQKKYLTETEKYELWKANFKKQIEKTLENIFSKKDLIYITVTQVDKWNVEFLMRGNSNRLTEFLAMWLENPVLSDAIKVRAKENTGTYCTVSAKTEDELYSRLMYLKLVY